MTIRSFFIAFVLLFVGFSASANPGPRGPRHGGRCECPQGAARVGPYCWYLGEKGQDCNTVCARLDKADKTPEHSSEEMCRRLAGEFFYDTGDLNVTCQNLVGCHVYSNGKVERCAGSVGTNSSYGQAARFCACAEKN